MSVHHNLTIELQISIWNPAVVQRQLVDGSRPNALRRKAPPTFSGCLGIVFTGRRRPGLKERPPLLGKRTFDGHANAHPTVVVQVLIGDVLKRVLHCLERAALLGQIGERLWRLQTYSQTFGAHRFGDHLVRLACKLSSLCLGDDRQFFDFQVGQGLHGPLVGLAGIRVNAIGDELLPHTQDLNGRELKATEGLGRTVHQQSLGGVADTNCRCVAQQPLS